MPLPGLYHPFHLHGYEFRVFSMGDFGGRNISRSDIEGVIDQHTQRLKNGEYSNPPGKDTIKLINGGYAINVSRRIILVKYLITSKIAFSPYSCSSFSRKLDFLLLLLNV